MSYTEKYLNQTIEICNSLAQDHIEKLATELATLREQGGRLFILGAGGSAANASHAVNDFRKLCGIETYAPTDNVSELTARTNDEGWETVFSEWLKISKLNKNDAIFVLSVGGGCDKNNVSVNIIRALDEAKARGAKIFGIVGRDGGYTAKVANQVVIIPTVNSKNITPHTEAFQGIIWHCLVSHPALQTQSTKW